MGEIVVSIDGRPVDLTGRLQGIIAELMARRDAIEAAGFGRLEFKFGDRQIVASLTQAWPKRQVQAA